VGIVFSVINFSIASAGMRTARLQLTRGSFLRASHARIVAGFTAKTSLASITVSNRVIPFTSQHDAHILCAFSSTRAGGKSQTACGYFFFVSLFEVDCLKYLSMVRGLI
jgi:hypothetical protein